MGGAYDADYQDTRRVLLAAWIRDPETRCWLCGARGDPLDPWEPDHDPPVALAGAHPSLKPAHRSCNRARGARLKAQRKRDAIEARAAARIRETTRYLEGVR